MTKKYNNIQKNSRGQEKKFFAQGQMEKKLILKKDRNQKLHNKLKTIRK